MCYHTSQTRTTSQLETRFKAKRDPAFEIGERDFTFYHSNGFAHQNLLMIPQEAATLLSPAMWGIIPEDRLGITHKQYYKESIRFGSGLNARSEKLFDHFIYKHAALSRRCLVPVDGFFEPHEHQKKKFPFYIHRKDRESFAIAGIYNRSRDGYVTMALLTTEASPFFARIHNVKKRQPVIIPTSLEKEWLNPQLDAGAVHALLREGRRDDPFQAYPVSKDLYRTAVDSNREEILMEKKYPDLDTLF
ncbi:SOS response-associated peptidase [Robertkochia flava]|uniref:SOS response-associated peptidase n=1 Tax=Robertkochia flava TaxID=3447986 RepID=UPI001CD007AF|nr:SOS response-associated peptidase [Robertkochia marina]